jgi:hypothetical protein
LAGRREAGVSCADTPDHFETITTTLDAERCTLIALLFHLGDCERLLQLVIARAHLRGVPAQTALRLL